jgi:kynurenine formamidase
MSDHGIVPPAAPQHASGASLWADPGESVVSEPGTGMVFVDLSHPWGTHTPVFPGYPDIRIHRSVSHASHGVMSQHIRTVMHNGTHVNAPIHLVQGGAGVGDLALDRFFGSGVVLPVPKERWGLVEAGDLEATGIEVHPGDIVIVDTGWHRHYSDSQEYFGEGPGLSLGAAEWLIEREAKLVGVDTATVDHPMATSLGRHRNGPIVAALPGRYEEIVGRKPELDFPEWNPAHRALLHAGIPTIENVGGALDSVSGRRATFQCYPWGWSKGDACVVRLTAIFDPSGRYRIGDGT